MRENSALFSVFADICTRHPNIVAIEDGEGDVCYDALLAMVDRFAAALADAGVVAGQTVGLCLPRDRNLPAAIMAILRLGCTYVPLDPKAPVERRNTIITQAAIGHIVCVGPEDGITSAQLPVASLNGPPQNACPAPIRPPLAAVIFTSGSTGVPKGVEITEAGILRVAHDPAYVPLKAGCRLSCLANPAFDALTFEVFGALLNGGTLCMVSEEELHDIASLSRRFRQDRPDALFLTASLFNLLVEADPECLRDGGRILVGGEPLRPTSVERFYAANAGCRARIVNAYGPTECATFALTYPVEPDRAGLYTAQGGIPIGRPIDQTEAHVLRADGRRADAGEVGRLFLGGAGVARGYVGTDDLTAEKFVHLPGISTSRLYDTGDMVRADADGVIHYVGRSDGQVKVRGHRVEVAEVENRLVQHPGVLDGAVAVVETKDSNQLQAVIVPTDGKTPSVAELRAFLGRALPPYMIPQRFFSTDVLPRTANGKIDRASLLAGTVQDLTAEPVEAAPEGPDTAAVRRIVSETLQTSVTSAAGFQELGGDSLDAMRVVGRLTSEHGLQGTVGALLDAPTIDVFARGLRRVGLPGAGSVDPETPYPAAKEQARLVFMQNLDPASISYNETFCFDIVGPLDIALLRSSIDALIARHASLRTSFALEDGQVIATPRASWKVDLAIGSDRDARALCDAPYDLSQGKMIRAALVRTTEEHHCLYLGFHHIAIDGHSITLLLEELSMLMAGRTLAATPSTYQDFARSRQAFVGSQAYDEQCAGWRKELEKCLDGQFAPLFARADMGRRAASNQQCFLTVSAWQNLKDWAADNGVTVFAALATVFGKVLAHRTGRRDIAIGTPVANRGLGNFDDLVGMCVNTLPVFLEIQPEQEALRAVIAADRRIKQGFARQDIDFDEITALAAEAGRVSPLFDAMLVLENTHTDRFAVDGLEITRRPYAGTEAKFPLTLFVTETEAGADLLLEFCSDEVPECDASFIAEAFWQGVAALPDHGMDAIRAIPVMDAATRETVAAWSVETGDVVEGDDLLSALRRNAALTPDAVAVQDTQRILSNKDLDHRSSQIAAGLKQRGVGHDVLVGICMTRCVDLLAAILGVWKAGAAYVPLDPTHPDERLSYLLEDSGVEVVLTRARLSDDVLPDGCTDFQIADLIETPATEIPFRTPSPSDQAYVMYTSGSTGQPKGVAISHGALAHYLCHAAGAYCAGVETALVSSAFTFDATLTTLLAPLMAGQCVQLLDQDGREVTALANALQEATAPLLLKLTPSHLLAVQNYLPDRASALPHCFVIGGEALDLTIARRFRSLFPNARLINEYGPTETVVGCSFHEFAPDQSAGDVPIGRPIVGARIRVLDQLGVDCPPGVAGEIMIGGAGLGIGYHDRPLLTAERFVTLADGHRYYASGDLAHFDNDGALHYLGRKDAQLKVRGYRIEPVEVESALRDLAGVAQAAVAVSAAPDGSATFVGYLVCDAGAFHPGDMKSRLAHHLPGHLIPDLLVEIDGLPFTPNGKLDRAALPPPGGMTSKPVVADDADQDLLVSLTGQIEELVGYPVDPDTNFFEAGLNSLLLMKLHSTLVKRQGMTLELVDFFTYTTPRMLAEHLSGQLQAADMVAPSAKSRLAEDEIAIIGMAVNLPDAPDLAAFWESITQGKDNFTTVGPTTAAEGKNGQVGVAATMPDLFDFDPEYFGLSAADAEIMDPQQRLILMGAVHALENAGLAPGQNSGLPIGVFVSSSENQYQQELLRAGNTPADPFQMSLLNEKDFVSTRIAYHLNLTGPAMTVQSACSSSLTALHVACQQLRSGECRVALAGGVSADPRLLDGYTYRPGRIYAHDGRCRAFGEAANGTVPANGMGLVVLKPLSTAQADGDRIYATIRASALSNDGHAKVSFTAPSVAGQSRAIGDAIAAAGIRPDQIGYIEAHGTGTALGDPVEFEALCNAFGARTDAQPHCALGSVKSQLGHTASAAGIVGLIRTALGIYGRIIPATFGAEKPNPNLPIDGSPFYLNQHPRVWTSDVRIAGVSSFGMGGTNAHVVVASVPDIAAQVPDRPTFVPFSAHCMPSLVQSVGGALAGLADGTLTLRSLARIQAASRAHYGERVGFECASTADAMAKLAAYLETGIAPDDLSELGQRWLLRLAEPPIDAKAVLPLDTRPYPFHKRTYRKAADPAPIAGLTRHSIDSWIYQDCWRRRQRIGAAGPGTRNLLFVAADDGPEALIDQLRNISQDQKPDLVIQADASSADCLVDALPLLQAAIRGAGAAPICLTLIARENTAAAYGSLLRGPMLTIPVEHPNAKIRVLYVPTDATDTQIEGALDGLADQCGEFALRDCWLFERDLEPAKVTDHPDVDHSGTHLVIGGDGGIGRHFSQAIAAKGGTIIALSRGAGADSLRDCEPRRNDDGTEVFAIRGDITDRDAMRWLAQDAIARFGALGSVYHCAGDVGSGPLVQLDGETISSAMASKTKGLDVIADVFLPLMPQRVILCSSMSAQFGVAGQTDYAAASSYTCAWAEHIASIYPDTTITAVAWPTWHQTGMAAEVSLSPEMSDYAITPQEGIAILDHAIKLGLPSIYVSPVPPKQMTDVFKAAARSLPVSDPDTPSLESAFGQVLGLDDVMPGDNFFDLGGDSLSALDLLDLLEPLAPGQISMADLLRDATVAGIRAHIERSGKSAAQTTLTNLGASKNGSVICVAPVGGDLSGYDGIVSKLAGRAALHGLRDPVYFEQAPEQRNVADLARRYLDDLNGFVPRVLVGWSFGAMVAWQMAHDLQSKAGEPPHLVLIDPPAIGFHAASGLGADAVLARELRIVPAASGRDRAFTAAMRIACTLNAQAMQSFHPVGQNIATGATLLVAQDGEAPPTGFASRADWLCASWQPLMRHKLAVQTLDTDHYAIMTGAAADRIAQIIEDAARATEPEDALG